MVEGSTVKLSIIIPVYNEETIFEERINCIVDQIAKRSQVEIIIVEAGGTHPILSEVDHYIKSEKGRAIQMNKGAECASSSILYFLHVDSTPPKNFDRIIINHVIQGAQVGCFQMRFDIDHWLLNIFGWMTKFNGLSFRGGDQSMFITKSLFNSLKGFDDSKIILEDIDFIKRVSKRNPFVVLNAKLITSARRYKENGVLYLQLIFGIIHLMNGLGISENKILSFYNKRIKSYE